MFQKNPFNAISTLSFSISLIYFWFGFLKFFPNLSPAETLAKNTLEILTAHLVPASIGILLLAFWECIIGLFLAFKKTRRFGVYMALVHMLATFTPFILLPLETYNLSFYSLTLVGQYIIKNIVIICALLVILSKDNSTIIRQFAK